MLALLSIFLSFELTQAKQPAAGKLERLWDSKTVIADQRAAEWVFTLSIHSVIYFPEAVLCYMMFLFLLVILGLPLLLLEIFTGEVVNIKLL